MTAAAVIDDTPTRVAITEPGVYQIPEDAYHADPVVGGSLSASGAKKLLKCPARFDYDLKDPPQPTAAMELGTAIHKLVLGCGADIVIIGADNYRTDAARVQRDAARAAGKVPLLPAVHAEAQAIAGAVLGHPIAGGLFRPGTGKPEQSLFWRDPEFGIWCRSRLDWLRHRGGQYFVIPDLKSASSADPGGLGRTAGDLGYHIQAAQYVDGVRALGLHDNPVFLLVFVETVAPYLVTVAEWDEESMAAGHAALREARERFRDCQEAGVWPGYGDGIQLISLPPWARGRTYEAAAW